MVALGRGRGGDPPIASGADADRRKTPMAGIAGPWLRAPMTLATTGNRNSGATLAEPRETQDPSDSHVGGAAPGKRQNAHCSNGGPNFAWQDAFVAPGQEKQWQRIGEDVESNPPIQPNRIDMD